MLYISVEIKPFYLRLWLEYKQWKGNNYIMQLL